MVMGGALRTPPIRQPGQAGVGAHVPGADDLARSWAVVRDEDRAAGDLAGAEIIIRHAGSVVRSLRTSLGAWTDAASAFPATRWA